MIPRSSLLQFIGAGLLATAFLSPGARAQLVDGEVLVEAGSNWEYLLYADGGFIPVDPATADVDFHTTWQTVTGYNGPPFLTGAAPLGYGDVTDDPFITDIWAARDGLDLPPDTARRTVYFRQTFTPTEAVANVRISSIVDDGAIVYINGVELTRTDNFAVDAVDAWDLMTDTTGSEVNPPVGGDYPLALPVGVEATIAVSLHSATLDSSDIGMNFRLVALDVPPATAPDNDDFGSAEAIDNALPVTVTGHTHDATLPLGLGATLEPGEPAHGGLTNAGSIWYTLQPATDGYIRINAVGSNFDAIVAVYLVDLTEVGASTEADPFYNGANVIFNASAGTTYWIAVSGEDNGGAPVEGENFGDVSLRIEATDAPLFTEIETLLPAGSSWSYLLYAEDDDVDPALTNQPVDPATADVDFYSTWHTASAYDGPAFQGPAPALLGYGVINANEITTDTWGARDTDGDAGTENLVPPTGLRYATYFRTSFTPTSAVAHLGIRGLFDDGAAIFINGVQVSNINFIEDVTDWQSFALTAVNTEEAPQQGIAEGVNLPANQPVEIAVALRNPNATSSDSGFDLAVYSIQQPVLPLGKALAGNDPLLASFDSGDDGDTLGLGDGGSIDNLPWTTTNGASMAESGLPNPPTPAGNALYVNNGRINFTSGKIDLSGIDNSLVGVTVDLRTFDTSSGFEAVDTAQAFVEASLNGIDFLNIGQIFTLAGSAVDPDPLKELELANGASTTFILSPGSIDPAFLSIRVVVAVLNNSPNEHVYVDNVTVGTDVGPPPPFQATVTPLADGVNRIDWNTDGVSLYELQFGDLSTWSKIAEGTDLGSFDHTVPAGDTEGYYRVLRFDD